MTDIRDSWATLKAMSNDEFKAIKRCSVQQMSQDPDLQEIGSSDINHHAVSIINSGGWPSDLSFKCRSCGKTDSISFSKLADEYCSEVENDHYITPKDVFESMNECSECAKVMEII